MQTGHADMHMRYSCVMCLSATLQESYGGEDAYFISEAGGGAFGVADGVGGWQESGINPAGTSPRPIVHLTCPDEAAGHLAVCSSAKLLQGVSLAPHCLAAGKQCTTHLCRAWRPCSAR